MDPYTLAATAAIVKGLYDNGLDFFSVVLFGYHQLRQAPLASPTPTLSLGLSTSIKQGHAGLNSQWGGGITG
jgi:hypothetical protein